MGTEQRTKPHRGREWPLLVIEDFCLSCQSVHFTDSALSIVLGTQEIVTPSRLLRN